jgi:hypothetical protein
VVLKVDEAAELERGRRSADYWRASVFALATRTTRLLEYSWYFWKSLRDFSIALKRCSRLYLCPGGEDERRKSAEFLGFSFERL